MHWHHGDDEAARRELVTLSEATGGALAANVATTRSALLLEHDPTQSLSAALDAVRVAREMAAA